MIYHIYKDKSKDKDSDITSQVEKGSLSFALNLRLGELNSGSLTIYNEESQPMMNLTAEITTLSGNFQFIVSQDKVTAYLHSVPIKYQHNISLVDCVMKLNKVACSALSFLVREQTLYEALQRVLSLSGDFLKATTPYTLRGLDQYGGTIQDDLNIILPKQSLNSGTLYEQLSGLANPFGFLVRLYENEIFLEKIKPAIRAKSNIENISEVSYSQDLTSEGTRKVIDVAAGIDQKIFAISSTGLGALNTPRSNSATLSDNNLTFYTPFPAYRYENVYFYIVGGWSKRFVHDYHDATYYTDDYGIIYPTPFPYHMMLDVTESFVTTQKFSTLEYKRCQETYAYQLHGKSNALTALSSDNPFFTEDKLKNVTMGNYGPSYSSILQEFVKKFAVGLYEEHAGGPYVKYPYKVDEATPSGMNSMFRIRYTPEVSGRFVTSANSDSEIIESTTGLSDLYELGNRKTIETNQLNKATLEVSRIYRKDASITALGARYTKKSNYALAFQQLLVQPDDSVLGVEEYVQNMNDIENYTNARDNYYGVPKPDQEVDRYLNYSIVDNEKYELIEGMLEQQENTAGSFFAFISATNGDPLLAENNTMANVPVALTRFGNSYAFTIAMESSTSWGDKVVKKGSLSAKIPLGSNEINNSLTVRILRENAVADAILDETYDGATLVESDKFEWDTNGRLISLKKSDDESIIGVTTKNDNGISIKVLHDQVELKYKLKPGYYYLEKVGNLKLETTDRSCPIFHYIGPSLFNVVAYKFDDIDKARIVGNELPDTKNTDVINRPLMANNLTTIIGFEDKLVDKELAERLIITLQVFKEEK